MRAFMRAAPLSMLIFGIWGLLLICGGVLTGDVGPAVFGGIFLVTAIVGIKGTPAQDQADEARRAALATLPKEAHPRMERPVVWVAAYGTVSLAAFAGGVAGIWASASIASLASGLLSVAVALIWAAVVLRRARRHARGVMESFETRADSMPPHELEALVEALEAVYEPKEVQPLRRLLPPQPRPSPRGTGP